MPLSNLTFAANLGAVVNPVPTVESGARRPDNSEVRKIAEDVLGALKYSYTAVAAAPNASTRSDSVEDIFKQALGKKSQQKRKKTQRKAADLLQAPENVRLSMFGRAAERPPDDYLGGATVREALVADHAAGDADQDRSQGGDALGVRDLPDGRSGGSARVVRSDPGPHPARRCAAAVGAAWLTLVTERKVGDSSGGQRLMLRRNGTESLFRGRRGQDWHVEAENRCDSRRPRPSWVDSSRPFEQDGRLRFGIWEMSDR